MRDDIPHILTTVRVPVPPGDEEIVGRIDPDNGLFLIQEYSREFGKSLSDCGLPEPVLSWVAQQSNQNIALIEKELAYEPHQEEEAYHGMKAQLNPEQKNCFKEIVKWSNMRVILMDIIGLVSSSKVQLGLERHFSIIVFVVTSVLRERLSFVSRHLVLQHNCYQVAEQLTQDSRFPYPMASILGVILVATHLLPT